MYSPYSALFKDSMWGGVPISLFALGAFTFFAGFALYLLLSGPRTPRSTVVFFGWTSLTPLMASIVMFTISVMELGQLCQTCVGIYISSFLLGVGGMMGLLGGAGEPARSSPLMPLGWLLLGEEVTLRTLLAGAVIVAGVALIVAAPQRRRRRDRLPVAVPVRAR